jgi:protease-4
MIGVPRQASEISFFHLARFYFRRWLRKTDTFGKLIVSRGSIMLRTCALLLILVPAGCARFPLATSSGVALTMPQGAHATVDMAAPAPAAAGPVIEMPLGACRHAGPKIAIIDVDGLILNQNLDGSIFPGDNPVALFQEKLEAARSDPGVRALVLRIHSPGGGVTATDMMWQELKRFRQETRRPVVACLLDVATGGAYYLACGCDHILAHPTTLTGGIGVIWNGYNLRDFLAQINIIAQPIKAGPNTDLGTTLRNLTPEAGKLLQGIAGEFHERFKKVVVEARPGLDRSDESTFDGAVFTAASAHKRGLIDSIGYLDDAVARARELAGEPQARLVLYRRRNDPAHSSLAVTSNFHPANSLLPIHVPGLQRSRLPTFLYLWQPDPALDR